MLSLKIAFAGLKRIVIWALALGTGMYVTATWRSFHNSAKRHGLEGTLVLSLTSFPPRFPTLALTLRSLLSQSVRPDRLELWIAESDLKMLPNDVLALQPFGVRIRGCDDLRSYKKIIPALLSEHSDYIIIADDDVYYPRNWLEAFVRSHSPGRNEVLCTRAHWMCLAPNGKPLPYSQWDHDVGEGVEGPLLFPTGIGGVFYESATFHPDVTSIDVFQELCPTADDVWLKWMSALGGARFRKIGPRRRIITWPGSQANSLYAFNYATKNDEQIANIIARYGFPN